ncbi:MAG TPA: MotA/TolQ/ExbB proton channel family protein, partial [Gammaproteobacteria bacterium]|nr:MotA/TolQ/ExbB proton channel family protein [Gammaproteobacteria bacterium]
RHDDREIVKESIEDTGRHVVHELERYVNTLGTIAQVAPLLGLLGTVVGIMKVFAAITTSGVGNPQVLAGGIAEALITTAAGLSVAVPALLGFRYLRGRVDRLVVQMEKEALSFLESLVNYRHSGRTAAITRNEAAEPRKRRA